MDKINIKYLDIIMHNSYNALINKSNNKDKLYNKSVDLLYDTIDTILEIYVEIGKINE